MPFGPDFKSVSPIPFGSMAANVNAPPLASDRRQGRRAFLSRIHKRRFASLRAAAEALDVLPEADGEALHAIMSGFYDLQHLLVVLLERFASPCLTMRIATLSLSRRNVQEMTELLDSSKVRAIDLLTSDFFAKHDDDIFEELLQEFHQRGQRVGAARSHCKIVTMALEDGRKYTLDGSPNLRTNRNQEQFTLTRDPGLWGFYDDWIRGMVTQNEVRQDDGAAAK